jgi:hypothetical protein
MLTSNNGLHRPVHLRSGALVGTTMHKMIRADEGGTHGGRLLFVKDSCSCGHDHAQDDTPSDPYYSSLI